MGETKLKQVKVRYTCEFDLVLRKERNLTEKDLEELSKQIQEGIISSGYPASYDVREADSLKSEIISEAVPYVEE